MGGKRKVVPFLMVLAAVGAVLASPTAGVAAFPGLNGKISVTAIGTGTYDIWTLNADGSGATNLTPNDVFDVEARWSPDGSRIAFSSSRDLVSMEIYVMNADGTGVTQITHHPFEDRQPAWSPDGSQIAFLSNRDETPTSWLDLYVMNADGTGVTRLTDTPDGVEVDPAWSPDGTRIAFASARPAGTDIFTINPDGTGETNLTNSPRLDQSPSWSPDGSRIAYTNQRTGHFEIEVMDANGSNVVALTAAGVDSRTPAWSPDETKIAFIRKISAPDFDLWTMNADGSGQANITNTLDRQEFDPDWQPTGPLESCPDGSDPDGLVTGLIEDLEPALGPIGPIVHTLNCTLADLGL
ncbi:MAG: hypothetical protein WD942_05740 [Dehalococcoidia bacterium]